MRTFVVVVAIAAVGLLGCSSESLSEDLVDPTAAQIVSLLAEVDVSLDSEAARCAAQQLTDSQATSLVDELDSEVASRLASAVTDCAGTEVLGLAALRPLAPSAADESLSCAAERLGSDRLEQILVASLVDGPGPELLELDLATALGLCLEPAELLNQG